MMRVSTCTVYEALHMSYTIIYNSKLSTTLHCCKSSVDDHYYKYTFVLSGFGLPTSYMFLTVVIIYSRCEMIPIDVIATVLSEYFQ